MNWPLKNQILLRMCLLLLVTIGALTLANIRSTISTNRSGERLRLQQIVDLVSSEKFPLTSTVLENMKLLSSADFILTAGNREIVSKTSGAPQIQADWEHSGGTEPVEVIVDARSFSHVSVKGIGSPRSANPDSELHIFMPRQSSQRVWWEASKSPISTALIILPLAFLVSVAMASQVTRPLSELESQVRQIAEGNLSPDSRIHGNREIQSLQGSINEMAIKLEIHDRERRKNERLRTLVQLGSSVAHHLRNAATGCKMAIELMASEHRSLTNTENFNVAIRQLTLMDNYIKKFLVLSNSSSEPIADQPAQSVDLAAILESVIFLLGPSAKHLDVELNVETNLGNPVFQIKQEDAEQLMINLISNGITAASTANSLEGRNENEPEQPATVDVYLLVDDEKMEFTLTDSGNGPPAHIEESIFEPFVTGSPEGTGLGLSVVNDIAKRVGGTIQWCRSNHMTVFKFEAFRRSLECQENTAQ